MLSDKEKSMSKVIVEKEINEIVQTIISDFDGTKNIDAVNIFNKPDKAEVIELVNNLIRVIYPGYFRDKSYKIYNPNNSFAVNIEDAFYHLNKQVTLALEFKNSDNPLSEKEREEAIALFFINNLYYLLLEFKVIHILLLIINSNFYFHI